MRNVVTLVLFALLLLPGCAKKAIVPQLAGDEAPAAPAPAPLAAPEEAAIPVVVEGAAEIPAPQEQNTAVEPATLQIFFEFDSYVLSDDSKGALVGNALWLQAQPEIRVRIEGHTDERGSSSYNLALGEKRAQAVRDYLVNLGVTAERVTVISYGKEKAAIGANDESVWAKDRRADFVKTN